MAVTTFSGKIISMYFWIPAKAEITKDSNDKIISKTILNDFDLEVDVIFEHENVYFDRDKMLFASKIAILEGEKSLYQSKWTEMTEEEYNALKT